ncbi:MAG TPA: hypothetical protein VHO90_08865 [Bacteroidales bacterium]|nr:hypothetical protein [Bacteroidales bacterium]
MIPRTLLILFCLFINSIIALAQQPDKKTVSVKEFTDNPWSFELTPASVEKHYGDYLKKEKYAVKSRTQSSKKDTIIRYFSGKTEIFFYCTYNGAPFLFVAKVFDKRMKMKGDIAPGMTSQAFYKTIAYPDVKSDTIKISLPNGNYNASVYLKNNEINHITIEARNKNR